MDWSGLCSGYVGHVSKVQSSRFLARNGMANADREQPDSMERPLPWQRPPRPRLRLLGARLKSIL